MNSDDDGLPGPRHRKPGRARRRTTSATGRHLRLVTDDPALPGAYPVHDLAAMSASAIEMLLHRARVEADAGTGPMMHVVITRDVETETVTESGPFATGLEALTVAARFLEQNRAVHPSWRFTLTVAPLSGRS